MDIAILIIIITAPTTAVGVALMVIGLLPDKYDETPVTRRESANHQTFGE